MSDSSPLVNVIVDGHRARCRFCPTSLSSLISAAFANEQGITSELSRSSSALDPHEPLKLKVIVHVSDPELSGVSAYFERWNMLFDVSDVLAESDLVLGLDWFTSYHDARLNRPSEGKIHFEAPRVMEKSPPLGEIDLSIMTRIYSTICDPSCDSFALKCSQTALVEQLDSHGLSSTSLTELDCKTVEAQRYALLSHILHGFCSEGRRPACDRFSSFCLTVPTSPAILSTTLLHLSASSKSFPLQVLKTICNKIFRIDCPSNHQRKSLVRQLQAYLENMRYLPVGIIERFLQDPSSCCAVTLNAIESMRKPQLQKVADAHGLQLEAPQTVEALRDAISLHISSGHCANCISSNGLADLVPLKQHVPRACLDIFLDYRRTSRLENVRASIVKAFSASRGDILELFLKSLGGGDSDKDDDDEDEGSDDGMSSANSSIISE